MPTGNELHAFLERHRTAAEQVFAIVDSARDPYIARAAFEQFALERWSLFPPNTAPHMSAVAPYLVPIPVEPKYPYSRSGFLDLWAESLGTCAGIVLTTTMAARVLWEHLQGVFLAVDEHGNELFFRYYDPRILRGFLSAVNVADAKLFFGPVKQIFVEGEEPHEMCVCRPAPEGTRIVRAMLGSRA